MLSPDFTFVDADGKFRTKAQLIAAINSDTAQYVSVYGMRRPLGVELESGREGERRAHGFIHKSSRS
jgi:hypothetical protein